MAQEKELLNVKIKKGTFYLSEKEDKGEGWTKQEFVNPKTKEDMVRYHKKLSINGYLNYVALKDDKFAGKVLSLIVGGEDESYALQVPVFDTGGTVKTTNDYFNSLVGSLENVSKGDKITLFVNNKNKDKNDRLYRNIVVLDNNDKLVKSNFTFGEMPKWTFEEKTDEFGDTKKVWDASPTNKFYIDLATSIVNNFGNSTSKPKEETKKEEPVSTTGTDDYDDLPF